MQYLHLKKSKVSLPPSPSSSFNMTKIEVEKLKINYLHMHMEIFSYFPLALLKRTLSKSCKFLLLFSFFPFP
jgi:hypothetical protein